MLNRAQLRVVEIGLRRIEIDLAWIEQLVAGATAQGFGLALWHLKPAPPGSAVASPLARSGG